MTTDHDYCHAHDGSHAHDYCHAHGGNLRGLRQRQAELCPDGQTVPSLIDASANLNPLGPPDWLDAAFNEGRRSVTAYPDPEYLNLRQAAAGFHGLPEDSLVFGNGADELFFALARCLRARQGIGLHLVAEPAYASYRGAAEAAGGRVLAYRWQDLPDLLAAQTEGCAVWLGVPNNPDGRLPPAYPEGLEAMLSDHPRHYFIVDEAFIDFIDPSLGDSAIGLTATQPRLIVLRSMTKFWAVPGLRLGYAAWSQAGQLRMELPNWPLNAVAEAFALRAFSNHADYRLRRQATVELLAAERGRLAKAFEGSACLDFLPGPANYYLLRFKQAEAGSCTDPADALLCHGIAARRCDNFPGLGPSYLRLAIRSPEENRTILAAMSSLGRLAAGQDGPAREAPAVLQGAGRLRPLMLQGCSSSAGKSLLTAAFCRIYRNRGIDVAPYKAQNMSLNSAVSPDGLELGRAQAVQAAACGLDADVRMNPVLLKPESDRGSQLVVMGRPYARYQARDYYQHHIAMRDTARQAFDSLASEHQLVILEGAGSPAEINLKARDFVNMGAARHAGASVLLVGDIDRGGVFASFIGTVSTFSPAELGLFAGFIVNKFRGDPELLGDAFAMTMDRTGYPVLGCVPMLTGFNIPDEDEPVVKASRDPGRPLRLAVPRLPRVSNFTDLDAFAAEPDVAVLPVGSAEELAACRPSAVIIPGSKSTVADLAWLRRSGLADAIIDFYHGGGTVVGICGGYQMLGRELSDPDGVESGTATSQGLGLLDLNTEYAASKTLTPTTGHWVQGKLPMEGYEIHHGRTLPCPARPAPRPVILAADGSVLGYGSDSCWGSYLHGLFDADAFRRHFLNRLRSGLGLPPLPVHHRPSLDQELDRLAEAVAAAVDLQAIDRLIGLVP